MSVPEIEQRERENTTKMNQREDFDKQKRSLAKQRWNHHDQTCEQKQKDKINNYRIIDVCDQFKQINRDKPN